MGFEGTLVRLLNGCLHFSGSLVQMGLPLPEALLSKSLGNLHHIAKCAIDDRYEGLGDPVHRPHGHLQRVCHGTPELLNVVLDDGVAAFLANIPVSGKQLLDGWTGWSFPFGEDLVAGLTDMLVCTKFPISSVR